MFLLPLKRQDDEIWYEFKHFVPDDYIDRINEVFKEAQSEVNQYNGEINPSYVVDRLKLRIERMVENFPRIKVDCYDARRVIPTDYRTLLTYTFIDWCEAAARNADVNLNLMMKHLHEDLVHQIGTWKSKCLVC